MKESPELNEIYFTNDLYWDKQITKFSKKKKKLVSEIIIWCRHQSLQYALLYDLELCQTVFECLLVEEKSILVVCAAKVHLLKLQDADHEQDADQPYPTRGQQATYPENKQTIEEVACFGLN